jgi:ferredoxin
MANPNDRAAKNVPGKYYVDNGCVSCRQCCDIAPDYFAEDSEKGGMYVKQQPADESGMKVCQEAMSACPVEAIGNNG